MNNRTNEIIKTKNGKVIQAGVKCIVHLHWPGCLADGVVRKINESNVLIDTYVGLRIVNKYDVDKYIRVVE